MRFKFQFDLTPEECKSHEQIDSAIHNWWNNFAGKTKDLRALFKQEQEWDLPAWMHEHLNAISPDLMWEFGPGLLGGHRLVITPESARHLRPLVSHILHLAPKVADWEFYDHRLPENDQMARLTVEARQGAQLEQMRFIVSQGKFNRIDIRCLVPKGYPEDKMNATGFVALECLLGEELLDRWVGFIDYEKVNRFPLGCVAADSLLATARRSVQAILAGLPDAPWIGRTSDAEWTAFEAKPRKGLTDYPARRDLFTQISVIPELHQCSFSGCILDSVRFSKCGETFVYLKIDGVDGLPPWGFKDRSEIDDALIVALEGANLGTVIGGGTGLRYSYSDLALVDVERAVPIIRETLVRGGVPQRSWILFFDNDFHSEWIGVLPDSPPPPPDEEQDER